MHGGRSWRLGHRPGLDGLRGVAVLLVVGTHLEMPVLRSGGTAGVTIFFVLSGFLIASLLLEEGERTGRISVSAFYRRRVARLLPALLALLSVASVALALGFAVTSPKAVIGTLFYVNNWLLAADPSSGGWLAHTWSLAIEEQFYLLAPLMVIALRRHPLALVALCGVGVVASVALRSELWAAGADFYRIYCGTDTRVDGLLAGVAVAVLIRRGLPRVGRGVAAGAALLALVFMLPGGRTETAAVWSPLIVALAAVGVLLFVLDAPGIGGGCMGWIGRRSYGIYLWHLPATRVSEQFDLSKLVQVVLVIGVTAVVAELSWRLVEQPAQRLFSPRHLAVSTGR